jgi:putative ABC transport system permease protein
MVIPLMAWKMLMHRKVRVIATACGIGILFLLSASQLGLLVGWCNTIAARMQDAEVDLWLMAEQTASFDYGTAIPRSRVHQARNVPGVSWAEGMYVGFLAWQRPDGKRLSVAVVGLDSGCVGGPKEMRKGEVSSVHLPDAVVVDELFAGALGTRSVGDEAEIHGQKAVVKGFSNDVRTFTASPFVFCSIHSALRFDKRYRPDEITYVLVRAAPGVDARRLARAIKALVPGVEVLTTQEFVRRSVSYWMLETGIGLTVLLTAVLGVVVSVVVTSQTLYTITQEHLDNYATLLALGFARGRVLLCLLFQGLALSGAGVVLGTLLFGAAGLATRRTPVPLETTPAVFAGLVAASAGSGLLGSFLSVRAVLGIDPITVFRA